MGLHWGFIWGIPILSFCLCAFWGPLNRLSASKKKLYRRVMYVCFLRIVKGFVDLLLLGGVAETGQASCLSSAELLNATARS